MNSHIGPQYTKDYPFKAKARLHQSKFLIEVLQANYHEYGNRLAEKDARAGKNFYPGISVFDAVKKRYPNYSCGVYANMLRSEHIPFNVFIPLKKNPELAAQVFGQILDLEIESITKVLIEYAPDKAKAILQDRTSFDTYIEYTMRNGAKGFLGIEVKYTESEYKLNLTSEESAKLADDSLSYYTVTRNAGFFVDDAAKVLRRDKFRQVWRNQLLGEAAIQSPGNDFMDFTSVTLYPSGNTHFTETLSEYKDYLYSPYKNRVAGITYEELFDTLAQHVSTKEYIDWVDWLKRRYIIE